MTTSKYTINPLVLIGVPTLQRAPLSWDWTDYYMGLTFPLGASVSRVRVHDQRVDHARNALVEEALKLNATYVLFVGDDVLCPSNTYALLSRHKADIVTGVYWTKEYPAHPYLWDGLLKGPHEDWKVGDYFPIDWAGCDCLLVNTDVFRAIESPWFSCDWSFQAGKPKAPLATEDLYFYTKARQAGYKLFVDTEVQCDHQDRASLTRFGLREGMAQWPDKPVVADPGEILVADIGAGVESPFLGPKAKVVRFDGDPATHPDKLCDIRALPVADETFDIAHLRHVLEHFAPFEAPEVVTEAARVVKPGGTVQIIVPNIVFAAEEILKYDADPNYQGAGEYPLWQLYGRQDGSPNEVHRNAFSRHGLKRLLEACGLANVTVEVAGDSRENLVGAGTKVAAKPVMAMEPAWQAIEAAESPAKARPALRDTPGVYQHGELVAAGAGGFSDAMRVNHGME